MAISKHTEEVLRIPDYLRLLDSLARFYNSQITVHVGYALSIFLFTAGAALALFTSIVVRPEPMSLDIGIVRLGDGLVRYFTLAMIFVGVTVLFLGSFHLSVRYLFARKQYYECLSQIVAEHMGLKTPHPWQTDPRTMQLKEWALATRTGIEGAIISLFEARLFLSKCARSGVPVAKLLQMKATWVTEKLRAFDNPPLDALQSNPAPYKGQIFKLLKEEQLLSLAYRAQIRKLTDSHDENESRRGKLLELRLRFDPMPCPICSTTMVELKNDFYCLRDDVLAEKYTRMPKGCPTLYFWLHTAEDFSQDLERLVSDGEFIVLEEASHYVAESLEAPCNEVSRGQLTPEEAIRRFPDLKGMCLGREDWFLKKIYRSQKRVLLERSPLTQRQAFLHTLDSLGSLEEYSQRIREIASYQRKRDNELALSLCSLCRENPAATIVVLRGMAHKRALEQFLTKHGVKFSSQQSRQEIPLAEHALQSKIEIGEEPSRKETLIALAEMREIRQRKINLENARYEDLLSIHEKFAGMSESQLEESLVDS